MKVSSSIIIIIIKATAAKKFYYYYYHYVNHYLFRNVSIITAVYAAQGRVVEETVGWFQIVVLKSEIRYLWINDTFSARGDVRVGRYHVIARLRCAFHANEAKLDSSYDKGSRGHIAASHNDFIRTIPSWYSQWSCQTIISNYRVQHGPLCNLPESKYEFASEELF